MIYIGKFLAVHVYMEKERSRLTMAWGGIKIQSRRQGDNNENGITLGLNWEMFISFLKQYTKPTPNQVPESIFGHHTTCPIQIEKSPCVLEPDKITQLNTLQRAAKT